MAARDSVSFWKAANELYPKTNKLATRVDDAQGSEAIAGLWRDRYPNLFNSVHREDVMHVLNSEDSCDVVTLNEINNSISKLSKNKAVGVDGVPAEIFIHASDRIRIMLALFMSS